VVEEPNVQKCDVYCGDAWEQQNDLAECLVADSRISSSYTNERRWGVTMSRFCRRGHLSARARTRWKSFRWQIGVQFWWTSAPARRFTSSVMWSTTAPMSAAGRTIATPSTVNSASVKMPTDDGELC
jgi:hypothetical protein